MEITKAELTRQANAAAKLWPFLPALEKEHGLLPFLMFAVGSRETNLSVAFTQGSTGDGGHGHGVWQLDDRWHTIPSDFDTDVKAQARKAAAMLAELRERFGSWLAACNAYNSGKPNTSATTGGNYGPDVLERQETLVALAAAGLISVEAPRKPPLDAGDTFLADIEGLAHPQLIGAGWRKSIRSGLTAEALMKSGVKHLGVLDASVGTDLIDVEAMPAALAGLDG